MGTGRGSYQEPGKIQVVNGVQDPIGGELWMQSLSPLLDRDAGVPQEKESNIPLDFM